MKKLLHWLHQHRLLIYNVFITALLLSLATLASAAFLVVSHNTTNVAIIYILAIVLIARITNCYILGIIASLVCVVCVNYAFTFPYMTLNFTMDGYPVAFVVMMAISCITSSMTIHMKKQDQLLNEREKMLMDNEKEKMRANLLRAVSHDLRTPLTAIIGASSAYLEHYDLLSGNDKKKMVKNIYDDASWLLNMVENLLSVTRIQTDGGNAPMKKSNEPLEEVVSEAVSRFHKRLPDAIVCVSIPEEFIMIPMDPILIEQIIINLLENAYYHSGTAEPIVLNVTLERRQVRFSVIDKGVGIPPDRLKTLFDGCGDTPNFNGDSRKGMGIGLSICKTIVDAHGGQIAALNHEQGAELTFTLPIGDTDYDA